MKKATKEDLAFHFERGKQSLIQKLVDNKVVRWNEDVSTDNAPAAQSSKPNNTNKDDKPKV